MSPPWIAIKLVRRGIAWAFYLGLLTAVGVAIFLFIRYLPRQTIAGPLTVWRVAADGKNLVTERQAEENANHGVVQVWSTVKAGVVHQVFSKGRIKKLFNSPNGKFLIARLDGERVSVLDCDLGSEQEFNGLPPIASIQSSPNGRWLLSEVAGDKRRLVFDLAGRCDILRLDDTGLRFASDDRQLLSRPITDGQIDIWDLENAKLRGTLTVEGGHWITAPDWQVITAPDGNTLLTWFSESEPWQAVYAWDLTTFRLRFHRVFRNIDNLKVTFSPDNRRMVIWVRDKAESILEMLDLSNGKLVWSCPMNLASKFEFSLDGSCCHRVHIGNNGEKQLTTFDSATGQVLWELVWSDKSCLAKRAGVVLHQPELDEYREILDARTGERIARMPADFPIGDNSAQFTSDDRYFAVAGTQSRLRQRFFWENWLETHWPDLFGDGRLGVLVMETATGRELFRIAGRGKLGFYLSDDASTLVTVDSQNADARILRVWDVHPHRAWTWVLSSVAATMLLCFCLSRLLRALRNRKKTSAAANC